MFGVLKYPIKVVIFKRYGGALKPVFDKARYEKKKTITKDGVIEKSYVILKKQKVKIPAQPISFYYDIDNLRYLYLLQIDRFTFYPISFDGSKIKVLVPTFKTDEKGKVLKDKEGKPTIEYVEKPIFDGSILLDSGKVIEMPTMVTHKTYDREQWLSGEIESGSRLYRKKGIWDRYGNIITLAIGGVIIVMLIYVGATQFAHLTGNLSHALTEISKSMNTASGKLAQAIKIVESKQAINQTVSTAPPY